MIIEFNRKVLLEFYTKLITINTVYDYLDMEKIINREDVYKPVVYNVGFNIGTPIWINIWNPIHNIIKTRLR